MIANGLTPKLTLTKSLILGSSSTISQGKVHTMLTELQMANLSHSLSKHAEVGEKYHPWSVLWRLMSCVAGSN